MTVVCYCITVEKANQMKVVSSIRYLGTDVGDSRLCFGECQNGKIRLPEKMASLAFSIIARSCNKMGIGKTYWKSVVQPRVLSATAVMVWTGGEVEWMKRVENKVWRQILVEPGYMLVGSLQGEIGASTVWGRDMKIKITFALYMFRTRNGLLEGIFRKMIDEIRPRGWMRQLRKYMAKLGISLSHLRAMSGEEVGGVVNRWEGEGWRVRPHCSCIEIR